MTWKFIPEHGHIIDPDVTFEDSGHDESSYRYYGGKLIAESINSENGPVLAEAQNMVALLKQYVEDDPCAPNPRYAEACATIERAMLEEDRRGLDWLHRANVQLAKQFQMNWPRDLAKANLDARAILFNCSNSIFEQHGIGITRAEVEGAAIIEKNAIDLDDLPF
jgi:hypothetical protein